MTDTEETPPTTPIDKFVHAVVGGVVKARVAMLPNEHAARVAANVGLMDAMEVELAPKIAALVQPWLESGNLPPGLHELVAGAADPEHGTDWIMQVGLAIGAFLGAIPALMQIGIQVEKNEWWAQNPYVPLSPADASDAVVRNLMTDTDGAAAAAQSGINDANFEILVGLTGMPPGPIDMLSLWRRGLITEDFLDQAIRYSRVKDIYIDSIKDLAHSWMSPTDAIELAIKEIVDVPTAQQYFVTAGGLDDQFQILYEAAGNSIGAMSAMNLWNHGLIDESQVDQILGRTRINPIFYDVAKLQRHKFLGVIQIEAILKTGAVPPEIAQAWMIADGYDEQQASLLANALAGGGTAKPKSETEGMIVQQYVDRMFTETEAIDALAEIGYSAQQADLIISTADAKRALSQQTAAVSAVRHAFMVGRITKAKASSDLDALNIPAAARDQWLSAWSVEQSVAIKELTPAQIGGMLKKGILSQATAMSRWVALGYDVADAELLYYDYSGTVPHTPL